MFHRMAVRTFVRNAPRDRQQCWSTATIAVGPFSALMLEMT
jgi:hypothetical protein